MHPHGHVEVMSVCVGFPSPVPPAITGATEEFMEEMAAVVNSTVVLHCDVTGHPTPAVSWMKDGQPVQTDPQHQISKDGTQLHVSPPRRLERPKCEKIEPCHELFGITLECHVSAPQGPGF